MIRDFIYLDDRKVLSFGSQILGGLADVVSLTSTDGSSSEEQLDIKAGIQGTASFGNDPSTIAKLLTGISGKAEMGLSGELNPTLSFSRGSSRETKEQKLLDHYKFTLLRNALLEQSLLFDLDSLKPHEWKSEYMGKVLKPGAFIELTCRVKIFDVTHLEYVAKAYENYLGIMEQMALYKEIEAKYHEGGALDELIREIQETPIKVGYEAKKAVLGDEVSPFQLTAMLDFIKDLSAGGFTSAPTQVIARHKSASRSGPKFIAPIRPEFLADTKEELIFKYGYEPEQDWKLLGQVCNIPKRPRSTQVLMDFDTDKIKSIDDLVQKTTDLLMSLSTEMGTHAFVKHPDVSISLIALYRQS